MPTDNSNSSLVNTQPLSRLTFRHYEINAETWIVFADVFPLISMWLDGNAVEIYYLLPDSEIMRDGVIVLSPDGLPLITLLGAYMLILSASTASQSFWFDRAMVLWGRSKSIFAPNTKRQIPSYKEHDIESRLCDVLEFHGVAYRRQPKVPGGRADVVTAETIYEVKKELTANDTRQAIMQLQFYKPHFPSASRLVIVTDKARHDIDDLRSLARQYQVEIVTIPMDGEIEPISI